MLKKFTSILIAILIVGVFVPTYVFADRDDITMEAKVGFDSHFKLARWMPVSVYIENRGEDINGDIEIIGNQDDFTAMLFTAPAVIPKGSKKRIDLYIRMNTIQRKLDIDLTSNGKVLKSIEVDGLMPVSTSDFMLGTLTDDQSGLSYWWEKQSDIRLFSNYEPIALKIDDIPEASEAMDNFSMLIIDDFDTSQLSSAQKSSISTWVNKGGILLIGTGGNGAKTLRGFSDSFATFIQIEDTAKEIKPDPLEEMTGVEITKEVPLETMGLKYDDTWKVVAGENVSPYVLMKGQGKGYIFISSFGLGRQPIVDWKGSKILWETIFEEYLDDDVFMGLKDPLSYSFGMQDRYYDNILEALSSIIEMEPPSSEGLIMILLIYLVVIGPINYYILKRLDRRELAWFTIPVLVMLFSIGIYGMGSKTKGNEVVANVISTVDLSSDSPKKKVETYNGIFIPTRGDYSFSMEGGSLLVPGIGYSANSYETPETGNAKEIIAHIIQDANPTAKVLNVNMWTMETFFTERYIETIGRIDGELIYRNGKIMGTLENNTGLSLENVTIVTNVGYYKAGNFAEGVKKDVEFEVVDLVDRRRDYDSAKYMLLDEIYPDIDDSEYFVERQIAEAAIEMPTDIMSNRDDDGEVDLELEAVVFGFSNQKLVDDIYVDGNPPKKSYYKNFIADRIGIATNTDGRIAILPGMIEAKLDLEKSGDLSEYDRDDDIEEIHLHGSNEVAYYFDMNAFSHIDIESLTVYLKFDENYSQALPTVRLYDREVDDFADSGDGFEFDMDEKTIEIDPELLKRYIDDRGRLYIKMDTSANRDREKDILVLRPTIGIEGRQR